MDLRPNVKKVVLLGDAGVGKSTLLRCLVHGPKLAKQTHEPTIGASFKQHKTNKGRYQFWDTAGQERFRSLTPMYVRGANIALLVYDVTKPDTLADVRDTWHPMVLEYVDPRATVIILVGNKCDCERVISYRQGQQLAKTLDADLFCEVSSIEGTHVSQLLQDIQNTVKTAPAPTASPQQLSLSNDDQDDRVIHLLPATSPTDGVREWFAATDRCSGRSGSCSS